MKRKLFVKLLGLSSISIFATPPKILEALNGNFKYIYENKLLKYKFVNFLKNVFHLYPEERFHRLIADVTSKKQTDKDIYLTTQSKLDSIAPYFSLFKYKLPALFKQKEIMAIQTVELLGEGTSYNGYLEIGSLGRYLDKLEEVCEIKGKRYYADGKKPSYSIPDMVDRGQITIGATYIPFTDYRTNYTDVIPKGSLDLVTVYIGFHHCPIDLRTSFIISIKDTLRVGGKLVLRDHDCHNEDQTRMAALAHDVFNMGTHETWEYNAKEVRNFYSLKFICDFIGNLGFVFERKTLYQEGDPTKNALMLFTKLK